MLTQYQKNTIKILVNVLYLVMPTILRIKGYRFFFFSREGNEPAHLHIEQAERYAKFWIAPVQLAVSDGFRNSEIAELRKLVEENSNYLEEKWNEYIIGKS